jgi:hypothetical protein
VKEFSQPSVFPATFKPTLQELEEHFAKHPELWDKNHPDYGMPINGVVVVDYLTKLPTRPSENKTNLNLATYRELAKKYPMPCLIATLEKK